MPTHLFSCWPVSLTYWLGVQEENDDWPDCQKFPGCSHQTVSVVTVNINQPVQGSGAAAGSGLTGPTVHSTDHITPHYQSFQPTKTISVLSCLSIPGFICQRGLTWLDIPHQHIVSSVDLTHLVWYPILNPTAQYILLWCGVTLRYSNLMIIIISPGVSCEVRLGLPLDLCAKPITLTLTYVFYLQNITKSTV